MKMNENSLMEYLITIIPKYKKLLESKSITHYRCNKCSYSQGHRIIYCPKCNGRMKLITETQLEDFIKCDTIYLNNNLYFKDLFTNIQERGYMKFDEWEKIIEIIKGVQG